MVLFCRQKIRIEEEEEEDKRNIPKIHGIEGKAIGEKDMCFAVLFSAFCFRLQMKIVSINVIDLSILVLAREVKDEREQGKQRKDVSKKMSLCERN